jgi:hypothetical protein
LNVHGINDFRQTEIQTVEPFVLESSSFGVEIVTEKLKRYKSSGTNQIPAELVEAGGNTLCSETHRLNNYVWNMNCNRNGKNLLLYL